MREIKVIFSLSGAESDLLRAEWLSSSGHLFAEVMFDFSTEASLYASLIMKLLPEENRVFFGIGSHLLYEHENMKGVLLGFGTTFDERFETIKRGRVGVFRPRDIEQKVGRISGVTSSRKVLESIFASYISWHAFAWPFTFVIAEHEPEGWRSLCNQLVPSREKIPISSSVINSSYAILMTHFDHGFTILSNKLTHGQLTDAALDISNQRNVDLLIEYRRSNLRNDHQRSKDPTRKNLK